MKWLRDPLVQFFLLGAVLLMIYATFGGFLGGDARTVEIGDSEIALLAGNFERQWRRPPTEDELRALVDARVREEILYREALALGLDTDDVIVRRRMVQKMELLSQDLALMADPTDEELQQFLAENLDDYRLPDLITFSQVYFNVDRRGNEAEADARAMFERIQDGSLDPAALEAGDASMIPAEMFRAPEAEVARVFGGQFTDMLFALEPGWHEPMLSPFGVHLVFVAEITEGGDPSYESVRAELIRDFNLQRTERAKEQLYEGLRAEYDISINDQALRQAALDAGASSSR